VTVIRILGLQQKPLFYQAGTSELCGLTQETPQKETTPFYPHSPYAVANRDALLKANVYRVQVTAE